MSDRLTTLYRPVDGRELDLMRASNFRYFPPPLAEQPFFYPVLTQDYAEQIARDWNAKDQLSGRKGYVLRFKVRQTFLNAYQVRTVGASTHREYWIGASELKEFNQNIVGMIQVVAEFGTGTS